MEDPNSKTIPRPQSSQLIKFHIQQLQNRRIHLLKGQQFKDEAEDDRSGATDGRQQEGYPTLVQTKRPFGGIYLLPPLQVTQERRVKTSPEQTGPVLPADSLRQTPAVTQCPSCGEVILTETCTKVGATVWTVCYLCFMIGCIAGCCLTPFFMDHLRDVHHQCPRCQAHIHTHQPL